MIVDIRGKTLDLGSRTIIMGILNITPDSFSDGGDYNSPEQALERAKMFLDAGAEILDVGGESTRPGYTLISDEEEIARVVPVIKLLAKETDALISIDTYKSNVARAALEAGCHIVNDIWGFQADENMARVAKEYGAYCVLMHNEKDIREDRDIISSMIGFLKKSVDIAKDAGIPDEMICLDPGVGFGRTQEQNVETVRRLRELKDLGYPVLLGTSRKSIIGKILDVPTDERLEGTIATNVIGVANGADIIRVHDVREHYKAMRVTDEILRR